MHSKMTSGLGALLVGGLLATAAPAQVQDLCELRGEIGVSKKWGSGWLDLAEPSAFSKGDRIWLEIAGAANAIKVRLLPVGADPSTTTGMIPGTYFVPDDQVIRLQMPVDRLDTVQISVHGGPSPWGKFPLGEENGPAVLAGAYVECRN